MCGCREAGAGTAKVEENHIVVTRPSDDIEDLTDEVKPYEKEGDCALYSDTPTTFVDLLPGQFMIVYPEDPHAPVIGEGKIRKLIAKVKL